MSGSNRPVVLLALLGLALALAAAACVDGGVRSQGPTLIVPATGSGPKPVPVPSPDVTTQPPAVPTFSGSISRIDQGMRSGLISWHPGCPVAIEDLRLLTLGYWGFDGRAHTGELIVHRDVADDVVAVISR